MINFSRRQLARYAVEEILAGHRPAELADRLAAALVASGRQKEIDLFLSDIDQQLEDRGLFARVRVTVARPLSARLRRELESKVKKLTGVKDIILMPKLDKEVLGGIKVETTNHAWDKTLKRMLSAIKETGTSGR